MTSRDSLRDFPELWDESDKYLTSQEVRQFGEYIPGSIEMIPREQALLKAQLISNCRSQSIDAEVAPSINKPRSSEVKGCLAPNKLEKNYQLPNNLLTSKTVNLLHGCFGGDLKRIQGVTICSNSDTSILGFVAEGDLNQTTSEKLQDDNGGEKIKNGCLFAVQANDNGSSRVKQLINDADVKQMYQNRIPPCKTVLQKGLERENSTVMSSSISTLCESKCLDSFVCHNACQHSKDVSKKLESSVKPFPTNSVSQLSEQSHPLKCHSSVTTKQVAMRADQHPPVEKAIRKPSEPSSQESSENITRLSAGECCSNALNMLKINFEEKGNSARCQVPCESDFRAKKIASSNIQRIQEQLRRKMENDRTRSVSNKVNRQRQDSHFPNTSNLQKQEKPYRQWHRMSRVLTAENRFIISHNLPSQVFTYTKNKLEPGEQEKQVILEEVNKDAEAVNLVTNEEIKCTSATVDTFRTECLCNGMQLEEACVDEAEKTTEIPLPVVEVETENTELKELEYGGKLSACSTTVGSGHTDKAETKQTLSDGQWLSAQSGESVTSGKEELKTKAFNLSTISVAQGPASSIPRPLPRHKSLPMKTLYMVKLQSTSFQELKDGESHCDNIVLNPDFISSDSIHKIKPLNSFSGASQISGPSFTRTKAEVPLELPPKKAVTGPKLRTATRSRKRCKSPNQTPATTHTLACSDVQSSWSSDPKTRAREISRQGSRHSRHGSRSSSALRGHSDKATSKQRPCPEASAARGAGHCEHIGQNLDGINSNCSSGNEVPGVENQKESVLGGTRTKKVFLADVANKLLQKVNRAGLRVHWSETQKKYMDVQATADYKGILPGQLSFRKGQRIKQRSFINGTTTDGMSYGYYRVGRLGKKKKGLFPSNYVTSSVARSMDPPDTISLSSSARSTS